MCNSLELQQRDMEKHIEQVLLNNSVVLPSPVSEYSKFEIISCSYDEKTLTLKFDTYRWQDDGHGYLHRGYMGMMIELTAMLLTSCYMVGCHIIGMSIQYTEQIKIGETVIVFAQMDGLKYSKDRDYVSCVLYREKTNELMAIGRTTVRMGLEGR